MSKPRTLTPQHKLFCYHYVELGGEGHGDEAAIAAGYAPGAGAKVRACKLLKWPEIQAEIKSQTESKERRTRKLNEAVAFNALEELAEMAKSWHGSKYGVQTAHVRAAEIYMHNSGQSPEAKKIMAEIYGKMNASEFFCWTQDELEHYASTGQRPARFTQSSGTASVN